MNLSQKYYDVRSRTEQLCKPLKTEDYAVQPVVYVSPPKWHLGHTTWFFETFIVKPFVRGYQEFDARYNLVFNSNFEVVGAQHVQVDRGNLSRPTIEEVYVYREHIDTAMGKLMDQKLTPEIKSLIIFGINLEERHQEILTTDIKFILGHNPFFPIYSDKIPKSKLVKDEFLNEFISIDEGIYEIGFDGEGFCFDNELGRHKVYLEHFKIARQLVTNEEYLEFIKCGGYKNSKLWHKEGIEWVKNNRISSPLYWHLMDGVWHTYTLMGLRPLDLNSAACHLSFYEATAYAAWKGMRLPTEFEWEAAAKHLDWGKCWEWTDSAYLPYPGFKKPVSALDEYNSIFMVNQMVLRGGSELTPRHHSRISYRNFLHPHLRWQYTGVRLAQ